MGFSSLYPHLPSVFLIKLRFPFSRCAFSNTFAYYTHLKQHTGWPRLTEHRQDCSAQAKPNTELWNQPKVLGWRKFPFLITFFKAFQIINLYISVFCLFPYSHKQAGKMKQKYENWAMRVGKNLMRNKPFSSNPFFCFLHQLPSSTPQAY